jgi:hypothetical protein
MTYAIQDDSLGVHLKIIPETIRDLKVIEFIAIKIHDLPATDTVKMMMTVHVRIKTPGSSFGRDDIDKADLRKRQQCPVDRVIGYVGKFFFHDVEHLIGCRMIFCPGELFVYRTTLRRDLEIKFFAELYKRIEATVHIFFLHVIIK